MYSSVAGMSTMESHDLCIKQFDQFLFGNILWEGSEEGGGGGGEKRDTRYKVVRVKQTE